MSRSDPKLKNLLAVIGFEVCLSDRSVKELMIYRSPVKYKKKSKIKVLSVDEINKIRSNIEASKTQKRSVTLFQNVARQNILKLRMIKSFGGFRSDLMSTTQFEPESSAKESENMSKSASTHNPLIKGMSNTKDQSHELTPKNDIPSKNTDLEEIAALEFAGDAFEDSENKGAMPSSRLGTAKRSIEPRATGKKRWLTLVKTLADKTNSKKKTNKVFDEDAIHKAQSLSNRPRFVNNDPMQPSDENSSERRPKTLSPNHHKFDFDSSDRASDSSSPQKSTPKSRFFQPRDLNRQFDEEVKDGQNNLIGQSKGFNKFTDSMSRISGNDSTLR